MRGVRLVCVKIHLYKAKKYSNQILVRSNLRRVSIRIDNIFTSNDKTIHSSYIMTLCAALSDNKFQYSRDI